MSAIVVEDLHKSYRRGLFGMGQRVTALAGVSLVVEPGETLGIIGPNGAGKTTLLGCLLGFLRPDSGRITIDGRHPDDLDVRRSLGYMPQRVALERWMNGLDLLRHHHALARQPRSRREDECRELLDRVGLTPADGTRALREYSGGMLQRIGLAQAMIGRPRMLFLDEPVSGVDPGGVLLFRRLLGELSAQGTTLVLNSHQLDEVERICTRVAFVRQGRVEAIEVMNAGAGETRVMRVRLSTTATFSASLAELATSARARFLGLSSPDARFEVADDAGATRLLATLLAAGVPVVEAHPEESRLERLFRASSPPGESS